MSISNRFNDPLGLSKSNLKLQFICGYCQKKSFIPDLEEKDSFKIDVKKGFELKLQCDNKECLRTSFVRCVEA